jgi:hypothetical protein
MKRTILTVLTGLVLATAAGASPHIGCSLQDCFTEWNTPTSTKINKCEDGSGDTVYNFRLDDGTETKVGVSFGQIVVGWISYSDTNDADVIPLLKMNCPSGACWTFRPNVPSTNPKVPVDLSRTWFLNSSTQLFRADYYQDKKVLTVVDLSWTIPTRHAAQTQIDGDTGPNAQ